MGDETGAADPSGRRADEPGASIERKTAHSEEWRLDYLFSIGSSSWIVHFCVTTLSGIVLILADPEPWIFFWIGVMALLALAMAALAIAYRRRPPELPAPAFGLAHSVLTAAAGLAWGAGAILCAISTPVRMLTFYTLVLGGTALGAVSSQHIVMRSCLLSIWTSVPLLAAAWLVGGLSPETSATAAMVMLFGVILTVLAVRMNRFLVENFMLARELASRNAVLQRTSEELAEAQEEKSRFLAQASHDLRQPIHAIGLFVEYLHGARMGRDGREVLGNIDRSLETLTRLCRSLLDLSSLDVGRVRPAIGPVPLGEVMGEVVRQAAEAAALRGVTIRFRPSRLWVRTDAALLHAMIQNLVSNAIKYAPDADLLLGVRRRGGALSVTVTDTGPGIAAADQSRIFKEFVQIERADGPHADGLGLGLSIVRRLAELLGLGIRLVSQPGRGATFAIDGFTECARTESVRRPAAPGHVRLLAGLRVLVVDDDNAVRESTVQLLARWGCDVRATARVRRITPADGFDFLLCDLELPGDEDGLSLIRRIREAIGTPVPAAIVTGGRTEQLQAECREGSIAVLVKPVRPMQLRSLLLTAAEGRTRPDQTTPNSDASPAAAVRLLTPSARSSAET